MLLLPQNAKILGQGITGSEGSKALIWMKDYGTNIVAGVTPGKGGQTLEGVPIFNTVAEALKELGPIDGAVSFVPPKFVLDASLEVLNSGIKFLLIGAEKVPTKDSALIYAKACEVGASVIGPNSVGLICPQRKLKLGLIGGSKDDSVFVPGNIAIVSKSGSMTAEIALLLKNSGLGVSFAVGIGGDRIIGCDFADFIEELESDPNTKASVIFGELGGTFEERLAEYISEGKIRKPVVAFIGGEFTEKLPSEVQFGHAGAIIEGSRGKPAHKREVLEKAGAKVAISIDEIPNLLKSQITNYK